MHIRTLSVVVLGAAMAIGIWGPAGAGPNGAYEPNEFTVEKVVEGPVPPGAVFDVEVDCQLLNGVAHAETVATPATFQFDENGAPLGPNALAVGFGYQCTATETVTNGAIVSYACEVDNPVAIPLAAEPLETPIAECIDDQTVRFNYAPCSTAPAEACAGPTELIVEVLASGTITVTNTFEEEPPPDVAPDDVAADGVVAATPPFTG